MNTKENETEEETTVYYEFHLVVGVYIDLLGTRISASSQLT